MRGTIRKASRILIRYPVPLPSTRFSAEIERRKSAWVSRPSSPKLSPSKTSTSCSSAKRVTFEDEMAADDEPRAVGFYRSLHLLDSLYELRRAGRQEVPTCAEGEEGEVDEEAEEDLTMMNATLIDCNDTEAEVRKVEAALAACHEPVHEFGGKRHASTCVSNRTLLVVRHKADLLHAMEERIQAFEAAQRRKSVIIKDLVADTREPPLELVAVHRFVRMHVHKGGSPADGNKTHFEAFASSFGLPTDHIVISKLHDQGMQATEWWAQSALELAQEPDTDAHAIQRLIDFAGSIMGYTNHPALEKARVILGDRLALKALKRCKEHFGRDEQVAKRSPMAQPQSARDTAENILREIKAAVVLGAPPGHKALEEARTMGVLLFAEERRRWALRALQLARKLRAKDEKAVEDAVAERGEGAVPAVGFCTDLADQIDREIAFVLKSGAPVQDPSIAEAQEISVNLREEESNRKRQEAMLKRKAAKKAKEEAAATGAPAG